MRVGLLAVPGLALLSLLAACDSPPQPQYGDLGLSRAGTSIVVWLPACPGDPVDASVLDAKRDVGSAIAWTADIVGHPLGGIELANGNAQLTNVEGSYAGLSRVEVSVRVSNGSTFVYYSQQVDVSSLPTDAVLLRGREVSAATLGGSSGCPR